MSVGNLDSIIAGTGLAEYNRVTFDASTGKVGTFTLFTVTGTVAVKLYAAVEVDVAGSGSIEVGTAITTGGLLATTTGTDLDAGEIWHDNSPDASVEASTVTAEKIVSQDIQVKVSSNTLTAGRIRFTAIWKPISEDSNLVSSDLGGSASPSLSPSASRSPSASISPSASLSPSSSVSSSPSASLSPSSSVSSSPSASISPSSSVSSSPSASISPSSSRSPSSSLSSSPSASASASLSPSGSESPSASVSPSASISPSASLSLPL